MKRLILILLFIPAFSNAQNKGCNYSQSNQFDFWIGEWDVYDTLGNLVGENRIEKQYENCVIQENWTSTGVNKGTSYNYFNPKDSSWNQLWLDNQGSILILKGNYENDRMKLKSDLIPGKKVAFYYNEIVWVNNPDGTVSQIWSIYDEHDNFLQQAFYGIYKRKED